MEYEVSTRPFKRAAWTYSNLSVSLKPNNHNLSGKLILFCIQAARLNRRLKPTPYAFSSFS
jgi:hypothetical protein